MVTLSHVKPRGRWFKSTPLHHLRLNIVMRKGEQNELGCLDRRNRYWKYHWSYHWTHYWSYNGFKKHRRSNSISFVQQNTPLYLCSIVQKEMDIIR